MKRAYFLLLGILVFGYGLSLIACATGGQTPNPYPQPNVDNGMDTSRWSGEWVEEWTGNDRYRIKVSQDGNTISISAVTRPERQSFGDLRWDGQTLTFALYFDNRPLAYSLSIDGSGNVLSGTVTMPDGQSRNISWRRAGYGGPTSNPPPPPVGGASLDANGWNGTWQEDWPSANPPNDVYQIAVQGYSANVIPRTNVGQQVISNVRWAPNQLTFHLVYSSTEYDYTLAPRDANTLVGVAVNTSGRQFTITWHKTSGVGAAPPPPPPPPPPPRTMPNMGPQAWSGAWQEQWGGEENGSPDQYQITAAGNSLAIQPITNVNRQAIQNVQFDGQTLRFNLFFGDDMWNNRIDYTLQMQDMNTLTGQVFINRSGRTVPLTWVRVGGAAPVPQQSRWDGVWEEYWPSRTEHDQYRIVTYGSQLQIQPLTNTDRQRVESANASGSDLNFVLIFGDNRIEYALTMVDPSTATGSVTLRSGSRLTITWRRVQ